MILLHFWRKYLRAVSNLSSLKQNWDLEKPFLLILEQTVYPCRWWSLSQLKLHSNFKFYPKTRFVLQKVYKRLHMFFQGHVMNMQNKGKLEIGGKILIFTESLCNLKHFEYTPVSKINIKVSKCQKLLEHQQNKTGS